MFERHIAIDWSGAGLDSQRAPGLAVAADVGVVSPPKFKTWSRVEIDKYLRDALHPGLPRALVAVDAALSFPDGFQQAVFDVPSWTEMVEALGAVRERHGTARETAHAVNARFANGGPFRFDESRNDNTFYREHQVAYFRAVELLMPQSISPFYLGSGASVGFHAITCLAAISRLMQLRSEGEVAFHVWPQEGFVADPSTHVIAECYPALYPKGRDRTVNEHERDALRTVAWMVDHEHRGTLDAVLAPAAVQFGRREGRAWEDQVAFEGWVLGV